MRHKSRHGEGESRSHSKDKKPAAPSEEPDMPVEGVREGTSPPSVGAGAIHAPFGGLAGPSYQGNGFDKALLRLKASEKDLSEVQSNLAEVQRLLKEAWVRARKMDDELLQAVKALENARTELPRQAVVQYKESADFKEGLKRMGQVTYEYEYRVALARFHARHSVSEVEEDPFTINPEDDLVPMERQQAFDDSDPPEP
ncbi:hypothetical protein BHM03_00059729 [Ensete ventricosum]|nr:hypothetical protein BHM03_00059729 [Ensete ventricosum]